MYDIIWQDGSTSSQVPSTDLVSYDPSGVDEFWPNSPVTPASEDNNVADLDFTTWGVVVSMDVEKQLVQVKWITRQDKRVENPMVEEVSVYALITHPTLAEIIPSQTVCRAAEGDTVEVGTVLQLHDGKADVWWFQSQSRADVYIDEIAVVNGVDSDDEDDDEYDEEEEEEEGEDEEAEEEEEEEEGEEVNYLGHANLNDEGSTTMYDLMLHSIMAQRHHSDGGSSLLHFVEQRDDESDEEYQPVLQWRSQEGDDDNDGHDDDEDDDDDTASDGDASAGVERGAQHNQFSHLAQYERFDSAPEAPLGHHYLEDTVQLPPKTLRTVMKEWNHLRKHLSDGIFLRTFDSHMDILQVLIIGPRNTPYHDSVFLFDVGFGSDYPKHSPGLFYHSTTGEQFNPNLYPDGAICLSLLGTWHGEGVEVWDPTSSSLLQVLLSIQGLILGTEEPYYLEAGFEKRKGSSIGDVHSLRYNPKAILGAFRHTLRSYRIVTDPTQILVAPSLTEIVVQHLKHSIPATIERIEGFLQHVEAHPDPSPEDVRRFFYVPMETSEGFVLELKRLLGQFKKIISQDDEHK